MLVNKKNVAYLNLLEEDTCIALLLLAPAYAWFMLCHCCYAKNKIKLNWIDLNCTRNYQTVYFRMLMTDSGAIAYFFDEWLRLFWCSEIWYIFLQRSVSYILLAFKVATYDRTMATSWPITRLRGWFFQ